MSTRVYLPLTSTGLAALVADGRLTGPLRAHAVTELLRAEWPEGDQEQWEYAALAAAAEESWSTRGEGDRPRRQVVAADVADVRPGEGELTAVVVSGDVRWKHVAAAHVDVDDLTAAPDEDGPELAWFATQEIADLF